MVELDLSNYETKADLQNRTVYRSKIAKKVDLASLKSELDIGKLENTPADLRKLSDAVKN